MESASDVRLLWFVLLNGLVVAASVDAVRRWTRDPVQRVVDVLLLWYVVQYVAVGLPGMLGVLTPTSMAVMAVALSAGMVALARRMPRMPSSRRRHLPVLVAGLAFAGFFGRLLWSQRLLPVFDSDALSYHLPAAVLWLQTRRLGLLPLWCFNPANTYSPLAGSTFIYWLLAPMHGDVFARFVQAPPVLLLWAGALQLGRGAGVRTWPALLGATTAAVSRLASSEVIAARDDLLLSAFLVTALAAAGRKTMRDPLGSWRFGAALGLALATKYTALISLPLFVPLWSVPVRHSWRRIAIAVGVALALAGPWYLRNLILQGNPLFPVRLTLFGHTLLPGLFVSIPSDKLRSLTEIRHSLIGGFYGVPMPLLIALVVGCSASIIFTIRRWRNPLVRACLFGPPLSLALFLARSPYAEVRYVYPAIFVACVGAGLFTIARPMRRAPRWLPSALVSPLALVSLWTSYGDHRELAVALLAGVIAGAIGYGGVLLHRRRPSALRRAAPLVAGGAAVALALSAYVWFNVYVDVCHLNEPTVWSRVWTGEAPGWQFVRENVPPDATIAYSQAYRLYPLMGNDLSRRLLYVPVRPDVPDFLHHPAFTVPVNEGQMHLLPSMTNAPADRAVWLQRLAASGAQYLFIKRDGAGGDPPEEAWADADPQHFARLFRDASTAIYAIRL